MKRDVRGTPGDPSPCFRLRAAQLRRDKSQLRRDKNGFRLPLSGICVDYGGQNGRMGGSDEGLFLLFSLI
ncbi:MAG: hypothetical protein PF904_14235 [Kiritimatiellae bacterium]|nr:hypothetical protein [Kiritimatiellia bacterium]